MTAWVGVDLDGTIAEYHDWKGIDHVGDPIPSAIVFVKSLLDRGIDVRIFTARVAEGPDAVPPIEAWCEEHLGRKLPVTNVKDFDLLFMVDDRAVPMRTNEGSVRLMDTFDFWFFDGLLKNVFRQGAITEGDIVKIDEELKAQEPQVDLTGITTLN